MSTFLTTLLTALVLFSGAFPFSPRLSPLPGGLQARKVEAQTAQNLEPVEIKIFWSIGCPHCAKERKFLEKLSKEVPQISYTDYEVSKNIANQRLMQTYGEKLQQNITGVPFTVIAEEKHVTGFGNAETTGLKIINKVREIWDLEPLDKLNWENITKEKSEIKTEETQKSTENPMEKISLPFFKDIDLHNLSLPVLTLVLALADGFNPCAMWVLLFLISLLIGMENPKRRWLIGGTFILASGVVYFLFLTAWLKFFQFIGFVTWTRFLIGGVALFAAYTYLKDTIQNSTGCKVTGNNENRKKIFCKLREFALEDSLLVAMAGITLLAFGVNLVEFFCSAGLPATYANILAMNNLTKASHYAYMALYVLIFMIDDFTIFAIAMASLKAVGMESKYARWAHFVGGLVMLFIGVAMLLKPEWLMFG